MRADEEAKKAVKEGSSPPDRLPAPLRKLLPRSKSVAWQEFMRKLKQKATAFWKTSPRYNRLTQIDSHFKISNFAKLTHNLHRDQASLLFQLRTGHVPLNAYLYKIQRADSSIC